MNNYTFFSYLEKLPNHKTSKNIKTKWLNVITLMVYLIHTISSTNLKRKK